MNVKLLRKIEKVILVQPKRLDMYDWTIETPKSEGGPECGTVACIAGWAAILSVKTKNKTMLQACRLVDAMPWRTGRVALKLTEYQADRLFYTDRWPKNYLGQYESANTSKARARVTVARIEHFIKTKGRE